MRAITLGMAVYLFLGSWFPQTDFSQWQKLGQLLAHYELHESEASLCGESLPFSTFLYQHFWQPDGHQHSNGGQHDDLPLQGVSVSFSFIWEPLPPLLAGQAEQWHNQLVPLTPQLVGISRFDTVFRPPIA